MSLSEICVRRPVFAFMLIMFLVTLGIFSFKDLGLDLFPRTDAATVYVQVRLPGASPEEVASQVVIPSRKPSPPSAASMNSAPMSSRAAPA